jgi:hypothetical protein
VPQDTVSDDGKDDAFFDAMVALALWRNQNLDRDPKAPDPPEITAYRQIVMSRLSRLEEGDKDPWMGRRIKVLVRKSTRYIVYLDEDLEVQWWWTQRLPPEAELSVIQANVSRLSGASAFLLDEDSDLRRGATWWARAWSGIVAKLHPGDAASRSLAAREIARWARTAEQIRTLIAESMAMLLNKAGRAECEKVQAMAEQQILIAKDQLCRAVFFWQFVQALVVLLLTIVVAQQAVDWVWKIDAPNTTWYFAALGGAFGAFLSAVSRTRALSLEPDSGRRGLRMEAYARALIGAGAGILVYFAFESGLIVKAAVAGNGEVETPLKMFLCIASGWSERILPALMARAETLVAGSQPAAKDG